MKGIGKFLAVAVVMVAVVASVLLVRADDSSVPPISPSQEMECRKAHGSYWAHKSEGRRISSEISTAYAKCEKLYSKRTEELNKRHPGLKGLRSITFGEY